MAASPWAKAQDRVRRIVATLGTYPPAQIDYPRVIEWQSKLLADLAPRTVQLH